MLLAIESATELVGVALLEGDEIRYEVAHTGRRAHAETLAPLVEEGLAAAGVAAKDLETVAVDVGPGLFTGLRVGVAMAKGLAFAAGIGIVPVTSLQALALACFEVEASGEALAVVDARRGEVFAARFTGGGGAVPVAVDEPRRYRPEELGAALPAMAAAATSGPLVLVGDGALRYAADWRLPPQVTMCRQELMGPPPGTVARLAAALLTSGAEARDPVSVEALYLRDADVRINWVTRSRAGVAEAG